jgi:hypothetical protein
MPAVGLPERAHIFLRPTAKHKKKTPTNPVEINKFTWKKEFILEL